MGRSRKHTKWHIGAASPECFLACKESFPEGEEFKFHDGNTTVFFFFFLSSAQAAFFVSAPFSSENLPHSHLLAQFQTNPKSSPNASHTSPAYIPNQKQTAVDNVPSLRDKVITHAHGLGMLCISTNTKIFRLLLYKILHRQKRAQFYAGFKGSCYTAPVSALHDGTLGLPSTMSIL